MIEKVIKRDIFPKISQHLFRPEITLLLGPRQSGKTTLLWQLKEYLEKEKKINPQQIRFFNLDIVEDFQYFRDQTTLLQIIKRETSGGKKLYLFVDEAQRIKNAGLFFKGIYDAQLPVKFVLTGSSALEIKAKIHEPLTGRKRVFLLTPFSFSEFLSVRMPELLPLLETDPQKITLPEHEQIVRAYSSYLVTGGYPMAILAESFAEEQENLVEIFNSYIEKDIIGFLGYQDRASFANLLRLLAAQIGSLVNINELSRTLGIARATVERYLEALEATFVTATFRPYAINIRKIIRKMPKIFFLDNGLRNTALKSWNIWSERIDQGALLEESIANLLWQKAQLLSANLFFFRTTAGSEVDFVFLKGAHPYLIEVKLQPPSKQELNSLIRMAELLKSKKILIVTLQPENKIEQTNTQGIIIQYCNPWTLRQKIE